MSNVCTSFQSIVHHSSSTENQCVHKVILFGRTYELFRTFCFHLSSTRASCVSLFFLSHYDEAEAYNYKANSPLRHTHQYTYTSPTIQEEEEEEIKKKKKEMYRWKCTR